MTCVKEAVCRTWWRSGSRLEPTTVFVLHSVHIYIRNIELSVWVLLDTAEKMTL